MRSIRLSLRCVLAISVMLSACGGGGDDGDGDGTPDAMQMDAMPGPPLTGLGQRCGQDLPQCPTGFDGCLIQGSSALGFCSKTCVASFTFMTNGNTPPGIMTINPDPRTQDAMCQALYTGVTGTGVCEAFVKISPAPPLQPNASYTAEAACAVKAAAGNACPFGTVFQMSTGWCVNQ